MKLLIVALCLSVSSFAETKTEKKRDPSSATVSINPEFSWQERVVEGGKVVCGYSNVSGQLSYADDGKVLGVPATAAISCVFVPKSK